MMFPRIPDRHIQLQLFEVERETDEYNQYYMTMEANRTARALVQRRLPMFYFIEAGEEIGVSSNTTRSWRLNTWPVSQTGGEDKILYKNTILTRVYLRLKKYPDEETYHQALARLQARINALIDARFTRNQIAQQMRMSFRTLKDLRERTCEEPEEMEEERTRKSNHCPWRLLERLENAEEEIARQIERQAKMQDLRIIHGTTDYNWDDNDPDLPAPDNTIKIGEQCRKCGAGWPNLRDDGKDGWNRPVMICMQCGAENALDLDAEDPEEVDLELPGEEEFVERYAPCRHCEAYWNHLKKDREDRWGNSVYICLRCATTNRVKMKPVPEKIL